MSVWLPAAGIFASGALAGTVAGVRWARWTATTWQAAARALLDALADHRDHYITDLIEQTGAPSGRIYILLLRMEKRGIVTSRWIPGPYPARRAYRLNPERTPTP